MHRPCVYIVLILSCRYDTTGNGDNTHGALISTAFTNIRTINSLSLQFKVGAITVSAIAVILAIILILYC